MGGLSGQVDGQHPDGQEQLDRGKNGALGQRDLEAVPTLVQLATLQGRAVLVTAFRAAEALGPAHCEQGQPALRFRAAGGGGSWQTEPSLKLNFSAMPRSSVVGWLAQYAIAGRTDSVRPREKSTGRV